MSYSMENLKRKITEFYPDIEKHQVKTDVTFDKEKNVYVIKMEKGGHALTTFLRNRTPTPASKGSNASTWGCTLLNS